VPPNLQCHSIEGQGGPRPAPPAGGGHKYRRYLCHSRSEWSADCILPRAGQRGSIAGAGLSPPKVARHGRDSWRRRILPRNEVAVAIRSRRQRQSRRHAAHRRWRKRRRRLPPPSWAATRRENSPQTVADKAKLCRHKFGEFVWRRIILY